MRLSAIIAIVAGAKEDVKKKMTAIYHHFSVRDSYFGLRRSYLPFHEDDKDIPPAESKTLSRVAYADLQELLKVLQPYADNVLTMDVANTVALVDVKLGDKVLLKGVPVVHLLWLEKKLVELTTAVSAMPVIVYDKTWKPVGETHVSDPVVTMRTRKEKKAIVGAPATDKHPAQVQFYDADIPVGNWSVIHETGAITPQRRDQILVRLSTISEAVKKAREEGNAATIEMNRQYQGVFDYILGV